MADPVEPIVVVLCVVAAIAAAGWSAVAGRTTSFSRMRGRRKQQVIACPKSGRRVLCTFIYREKTDECVGLEDCSDLNEPIPTCDCDCVRLMKLGIPLRPTDTPR